MEKFRTQTGQTGRDAFVNELSQIINHRRVLQERLEKLIETIQREVPEGTISKARRDEYDLELQLDIRSVAGMSSLSSLSDLLELLLNWHPEDERGGEENVEQ
jgi:hypothetical protein